MSMPTPTGAEWVATNTLIRWSTERGVHIDGPALGDLDPIGRHVLTSLTPVGASAGFVFRAVLRGGRQAALTVTFPVARMREVLASSYAHLRDSELYGLGAEPSLEWAGTRSLAPVRARLENAAIAMFRSRWGPLPEIAAPLREMMADGAGPKMSLLAAHGLRDAVPIVVDPQTMAGLPAFDDLTEAFRYGEIVALPFPVTYLDTTGEDGRGVPVEVALAADRSQTVELFGALVSRSHDGGLAVLPLARSATNDDDGGSPEIFGRVVFGVDPPAAATIGEQEIPVPGWDRTMRLAALSPGSALMLRAATGGMQNTDPLGLILRTFASPGSDLALRGRIEVGGSVDDLQLLGPAGFADGDNTDLLFAASRVLVALACELLGVFYFLDAPGVSLETVPMARPQRRQAQRQGQQVAQTVTLRPVSRGFRTSGGEPGKGAHSYQYLVRGVWAHYPLGTRMADARPDLVKPCPRERCQGQCRRILHPPHWRGPAGGPIVLKTRVLPLLADPATDPAGPDDDPDTQAGSGDA